MAAANGGPETLIFWGAGATRTLGIRTTADQGRSIQHLADTSDHSTSLENRVEAALSNRPRWRSAFVDLLTILGDSSESYSSISNVSDDEVAAMRQNWREGADERELRKRVVDLRLIYDWPALKSAIRVCPGATTEQFLLNDLFNLLDMHIPVGSGFRGPGAEPEPQFFDTRRLIGAKNALMMILSALLYIDYRQLAEGSIDALEKYREFARVLGRRMQRQGRHLASEHLLHDAAFYLGDVGFVSLNYDPVGLWVQFSASRELNQSNSVPHIGCPSVPLHVFQDFGHLIPSRRIDKGNRHRPWYPMNEAAVQRINEAEYVGPRVRLTKFLFPHGSLCWRECPDCGKLSAYYGDLWALYAPQLIPPPPLRAFDPNRCLEDVPENERSHRNDGKVDARSCLHCGTMTFAHHTQAVMQSSFKSRPPSFIEEIQRELRATAMRANHIIFMGYSLPPDDVTYRAFFAARSQRGEAKVRCTVVNKDSNFAGWCSGEEAKKNNLKEGANPMNAACDIFGRDNVRFYGGGVPEVFLEGARVTEASVERLLNWSA